MSAALRRRCMTGIGNTIRNALRMPLLILTVCLSPEGMRGKRTRPAAFVFSHRAADVHTPSAALCSVNITLKTFQSTRSVFVSDVT